MAEQRLPTVDGDDGAWGDILNQFIAKEHYNTGLDNVTNGSHQHITLRPGTTTAGTAPIKFASGPLLGSTEVGALEFLTDRLYITQTTASARKTIAHTDDVTHTPTAVWGDSVTSSSVVSGSVCYVRVPYSGTINSWSIISNISCTCVLDVWKLNNSVPTVANTITAAAKPGLSATATATSSTLTSWTTSVVAGDVLGFKLDSLTGAPTSISLILNIVG